MEWFIMAGDLDETLPVDNNSIKHYEVTSLLYGQHEKVFSK